MKRYELLSQKIHDANFRSNYLNNLSCYPKLFNRLSLVLYDIKDNKSISSEAKRQNSIRCLCRIIVKKLSYYDKPKFKYLPLSHLLEYYVRDGNLII